MFLCWRIMLLIFFSWDSWLWLVACKFVNKTHFNFLVTFINLMHLLSPRHLLKKSKWFPTNWLNHIPTINSFSDQINFFLSSDFVAADTSGCKYLKQLLNIVDYSGFAFFDKNHCVENTLLKTMGSKQSLMELIIFIDLTLKMLFSSLH